jgi:hypothetical protein
MRIQLSFPEHANRRPRPYVVFLTALLLAICFTAACGSDDSQPDATVTPAGPTTDIAGICSGPIPALTADPVTEERLLAAIDKMGEVKAAAAAGDHAAANAAFAGDAHTITHDIDPLLRAEDPQLAQDLCASIVLIEQEFGAGRDLGAVAASAEVAAGLLDESGRLLGPFD